MARVWSGDRRPPAPGIPGEKGGGRSLSCHVREEHRAAKAAGPRRKAPCLPLGVGSDLAPVFVKCAQRLVQPWEGVPHVCFPALRGTASFCVSSMSPSVSLCSWASFRPLPLSPAPHWPARPGKEKCQLPPFSNLSLATGNPHFAHKGMSHRTREAWENKGR